MFDSDWTAGATTFRVQGAVTIQVFHDTDRLGGAWCWRDGPAADYTWSVSGKTLTLAPVGGLRLHDCRHTFASILISQGSDVVTVSRQLGHASPSTTLNVYAHLFDQARHADRTRAEMEQEFGVLL